MDRIFCFVVPAFQQIIFETQDAYGAFIKFLPARCQIDAFRRAHQKTGLKLFFQHTDMGTDGRLGDKELFRSFREAAVIDNSHEGLQLFELHGVLLYRMGICLPAAGKGQRAWQNRKIRSSLHPVL